MSSKSSEFREYTNFKFGDLMHILEQSPNMIVFIGTNDFLSSQAKVMAFELKDQYPVIYLNYDRNKSLMIDLNIRRVPVILFFKNMDLQKEMYPPFLKESVVKAYEELGNK